MEYTDYVFKMAVLYADMVLGEVMAAKAFLDSLKLNQDHHTLTADSC